MYVGIYYAPMFTLIIRPLLQGIIQLYNNRNTIVITTALRYLFIDAYRKSHPSIISMTIVN